uniref:Uncharacterized protein n=1 Tax=Entomoneis paludosa TaxID=265537 RepID=A0A7S3DP12_9STRA
MIRAAGSSSGPSSSNCQALLGSMLSAMNQNRSQESSSTQAPRPVASSQSDAAATALIKQAPRPSPAPGPQDISASDSLEPRPFSPTEHQEAAAAVSANSSVAPVEGMAEATTKHVQPTSDLAEAPQDPLKIWENLISDDEDWSRSSNEQQSLNATHTHSQDKLGLPLDDELLLAGDDQAPDLEELLADESFLESVPMQVETSWTPADFPDAQSMMRANRLDFELLDPLMSDSLYPLGPGP